MGLVVCTTCPKCRKEVHQIDLIDKHNSGCPFCKHTGKILQNSETGNFYWNWNDLSSGKQTKIKKSA